MSGPFTGKRVLLGVTGSIAAYKAVDLASKLTQAGALVDVLLTKAAMTFVAPLTFRSITHRSVLSDLWDPESEHAVEHVELARSADILAVAPATANTIAKLALGVADDPVGVVALATAAPVLVAPAMDAGMWDHAAVRANVARLRDRGVHFAGPAKGHLASGLEGWGRLVETPELMGRIAQVLGENGDLAGRTVVVSAGGTQEPIDPVRVISNRSSGKMGYAVAEAARDRGARVVLVAARTVLADPAGIETVHVETVEQVRSAVLDACRGADVLIMAAAVADFRVANASAEKIKKQNGKAISLELTAVEDFFHEVPPGVVRVGFAAESQDLLENARAKLDAKALDLIAANDITQPDAGFGADTNRVTLLAADGTSEELPLMLKYDVAQRLLDRVVALLRAKGKVTAR